MNSETPMASDGRITDVDSLGSQYEVFLSFRGPDTRIGFTDHLHVRLTDAGIRVYKDDEELRKGEKIGPELLKGISESKIAVPIFSKGYAASKWCLQELAQIMECRRSNGLKVMPIFYNVTPSDVRNQTGNYAEAFESHEKCHDKNTIEGWKAALREAGELSGWDILNGPIRQEGELVKEVNKIVLRELKKAYLVVADNLVGLDHHVEEISNTLIGNINGVQIVGIYGMGGIGKTTLAKEVYNYLLSHFDNHCFLSNIRENARSKGMEFIQKKLIIDILKEESTNIPNIEEGIKIIGERFSRIKVLLLLDDIDENEQLKALIEKRNWFGFGSIIIITTRDKSILDWIEVDHSRELSGLESSHALQLFSQHAFRKDKPPNEYAILSTKVIERAGGLPLALEVFGSLLHGKNKEAWDHIVEKLEKVPPKMINKKLMISFEALDDGEKQIFLDIACFFIGENKRIVVSFWDESEFPEAAIEVLQQMSLIKIQEDHLIWMHDILRDFGREIVQREHNELGNHSRLWNAEEATELFMRKMGGANIRGINLNFRRKTEYSNTTILNEEFAKLSNLRLLRVEGFHYEWYKNIMPSNFFGKSALIFSKLRWLSWHHFPPTYDTSKFSMENLVILDLSHSKIKSNWSGWRQLKVAKNLKVLNLTRCRKLVRTPDFSSHPKLEQLILRQCFKLVEIHESISMLEHLVILDLYDCLSLRKLPKVLNCTESLEELIISGTSILEIPPWPPMRRLRVFECTHCFNPIKVNSLDFAANVTELSFGLCVDIEILPESIGGLVSLIKLDLSFSAIAEIPNTIGNLKNLKELSVRHTSIRKLPTAIGMLENLVTLDAYHCDLLHNIPRLPQSLISLKLTCQDIEFLDLSSLIDLKNLSLKTPTNREYPLEGDDPALWWIGSLTNLESLTLWLPHIISLHPDLGVLSQLTELSLYACHKLQSIPKLPSGLKKLSIQKCKSFGSLLDLSCLRKLDDLYIKDTPISKLKEICSCESLKKLVIIRCDLFDIDGVEMLENLTTLIVRLCDKLQRLPDLSNLKKLKELEVRSCPNLVEIPGRLESLKKFHIEGCKSLERIPDIPNSENMGYYYIKDCGKIKSISRVLMTYPKESYVDEDREDLDPLSYIWMKADEDLMRRQS